MKFLRTAVKLFLLAASAIAGSLQQTVELPEQLRHFVEENTRPIELETADLDGDGLMDFLMVLERTRATGKEGIEGDRVLLVIVRQRDGSLIQVKRSDGAVPDAGCGGPSWGDCFQGIQARPRSFTIETYGGSSWRIGSGSTFTYSRRDRTWQLTRVEITTFHVSKPDQPSTHVFRPPRDFGKIDIADFHYDSVFHFGPNKK